MCDRIEKVSAYLKKLEAKGHTPRSRLPGWASSLFLSAGIALGTVACQPPAAENESVSDNNLNNTNNGNNATPDAGADADVIENVMLYGVPQPDGGNDAEPDVPPVDTLYGVPDAGVQDGATDVEQVDAAPLYGKAGE